MSEMVDAFLKNIYFLAERDKQHLITDEFFDVLPELACEKRFDELNEILKNLDVSKLDSGSLYSFMWQMSYYAENLTEYAGAYYRVREEAARQDKDPESIADLYDDLKDGNPVEKRQRNVEGHTVREWERINEQILSDKIKEVEASGDDYLAKILISYKTSLLREKEANENFRKMRMTYSEEEIRKKSIDALRAMATLLENSTGCWPGIYYCNLPKEPIEKGIMNGIEVVTSYPWPG